MFTLNNPTVPQVLALLNTHRPTGVFAGTNENGQYSARIDLWLINAAWIRGCNFEALADGFGLGMGTNGDFSAIRDSSEPAIKAMFTKAKRYLK